tara:strand:- start:3955 stop:4725 length:771 start_codon:yes stop_codon:yes gene_type:complete
MTENRKISELTEVTTLRDDDEFVFVAYGHGNPGPEPTPTPITQLSTSLGITEFPNVSGGNRLDHTITWDLIPGVANFDVYLSTHNTTSAAYRKSTETIPGNSTSYTIPSSFLSDYNNNPPYLFVAAVATYEDGTKDNLHRAGTNAIALHTAFDNWTLLGKVTRNVDKSARKLHINFNTVDKVTVEFARNNGAVTKTIDVNNPQEISYPYGTDKFRFRVEIKPDEFYEQYSAHEFTLQNMSSPTNTLLSGWSPYYSA